MPSRNDRLDLLKHALLLVLLIVGWLALTLLSHNVVVQSVLGWVGLGAVALYARWLLKKKLHSDTAG